MNVTSRGRCNVRKYREIKNGDKYIILCISSYLDFLDKKEVTSSEPNNYRGISCKGLNASLYLMTKISNKKQKDRLSINALTNKYFHKLLNNFNNSLFLGDKSKQVCNEPTEACLFRTKYITNIRKIESHV